MDHRGRQLPWDSRSVGGEPGLSAGGGEGDGTVRTARGARSPSRGRSSDAGAVRVTALQAPGSAAPPAPSAFLPGPGADDGEDGGTVRGEDSPSQERSGSPGAGRAMGWLGGDALLLNAASSTAPTATERFLLASCR